MTLPSNFSPWEHLQDQIRRDHNKLVAQHFRDLGGEDWVLDVSTPRSSLRTSCTIQDNDTATMTVIRLFQFYIVCKKAQDLQAVIYGLPATEFHETKEFLPQVVLWFREKSKDAKSRNSYPVKARFSFRVMDKNFSVPEAKSLALKIKQVFATPKASFKKGEVKISYRDPSNGYEFIIAAYNESEAKEIITKILSLANKTPDWENLTNSESGRNFKQKKKKMILGKEYETPNRRPVATVYFAHAELKIHGMTEDKILVDTTGRFSGAYEYAL